MEKIKIFVYQINISAPFFWKRNNNNPNFRLKNYFSCKEIRRGHLSLAGTPKNRHVI
jgi:hypothetical protein